MEAMNQPVADCGRVKLANEWFSLRFPSNRTTRLPEAKGRTDIRGLPCISPWVLRWFTGYSRRYIRRHFHSLRISRAGLPPEAAGRALVLYSNHASWWDALVCLVLTRTFFPERAAFAPIDAGMLERYRFFRYLGFFGIEQESLRGAARFMRASENILQSGCNLLALTPQGSFVDVRQRPVRFAGGLGHLALRVPNALFVPVALEYVFWEERLPEILVRFGAAVDPRLENGGSLDARGWTRLFEQKLAETQDALALEGQRRCADEFYTVLRGGAGQGGIYDWWRAFAAVCRGESFRREHGNK